MQLFRDLSTDEFHNFDAAKQENLLGPYYMAFSGFCDFLQRATSDGGELDGLVESMSCDIQDDGIRFDLNLNTGVKREVFFSKDGK